MIATGHYSGMGTALQMPVDSFVNYWPDIQRELDKVPHIWTPWWTKESIYQAIMCGQWQVWAAGHDSKVHLFMFTQIAYFPAGSILQSTMLLGNSFEKSIDALWAVLEDFARKNGCSRVEVVGRKGFERILARYGLRPYGVALACSVSELRMQ